uniref:TNFR-Cys domain-containing protein n=1 Tax=Lates calcarifer TaxID=8187 RepID=A0A4W6FFK7_LATCA
SPSSSSQILLMKVFSQNSLTCHPAEYQIGNECCPMCPPGSRVKTDCTEFRSRSCLPCLEGTYMNHPAGLKNCFPCTNCNTGSGLKIKTSCTSTSDTVCKPLEGFYCIDVKDKCCMAAQRHKHCEPGQYISKKGTASTDTECSDCTDGTFSDGTFTSCHCSETQVKVKEGGLTNDVVCSSAWRNHYFMFLPLICFLSVTVVGLVTRGYEHHSLLITVHNRINHTTK